MPKYKADKNGIFSTMVWDGTYNEDGTKHRKHLRSSKSSRDLERQVLELATNVKTGSVVDGSITFGQYSQQWLALKSSNIKSQTKYAYDFALNSLLEPLNCVRLDNLTPAHYNSLLEGKSSSTAYLMRVVYKQIIKQAMLEHRISRQNGHDIIDAMISIKGKKKAKRPLTDVESKAIFELNLTPRDKCFLYLLYGTGMRRGEALAITKDDIDLKNKTISVTKTRVRTGIQDTPKSENSTRVIPMPQFLVDYLQEYLPDAKYYILSEARNVPPSFEIAEYVWKKIRAELVKQCGSGEDLTMHCLRHNYCSALCYQVPLGRISLKKIAQLMGDTVQTVQQVYDHIIEEKESPELAIDAALNR